MRITLLVESEFAFHLVRITCFIGSEILADSRKHMPIWFTQDHILLFYQYLILNQSNSLFFLSFLLIYFFVAFSNQLLFGGSTIASASVFSFYSIVVLQSIMLYFILILCFTRESYNICNVYIFVGMNSITRNKECKFSTS